MHLTTDNSAHNKILEKAGLNYLEQIARALPKKYLDHRYETGLDQNNSGESVVLGILKKIKVARNGNKTKLTQAVISDRISGKTLMVTWFETDYPYRLYADHTGNLFLVCGKATYNDQWGFQIISPNCFTDQNISEKMILVPLYKKYRGMSADSFQHYIQKATTSFLDEPCSSDLKAFGIGSLNEISRKLHYPATTEEIEDAIRQIVLTDITYFASSMKLRDLTQTGKTLNIRGRDTMDKAIDKLPYTLTKDQANVVNEITTKLQNGERINALVQGDVSCGKTITAILMLLLAAENGYQAALLAPTVVLASQHYEDIKKITEPFGLRVKFLGSSISKKDKARILENLKSGEIDILVGTHAVTMPDVVFKNLGLVVIDEEQRFGVERRECLKEKSENQIAYITMSATPIPRTLASTIYGEHMMIFTIHSMPSGRQPVTTIKTDDYTPPSVLLDEIRAGRQAYVICPLVDSDDENPCMSCKETVEMYEKFFTKHGLNVAVGCLNGQMKEKEMLSVLSDFMNQKISVLVSTTVVEVGVNNPNASVIVIQDADRFGLSSLHQLRGRVRRGSYKPYCILMAKNADNNPRLDAMCRTEDGFELSVMDLDIRKAGNLLGNAQSGKDRFIPLIEKYPKMYEYAKIVAMELIKNNQAEPFVKYMSEIYG